MRKTILTARGRAGHRRRRHGQSDRQRAAGAAAAPGMDGHRRRARTGWAGCTTGATAWRDGQWARCATFALVYRQEDRKLTPPDVQKIAEAFLLWNGNHSWKVVDVAPAAGRRASASRWRRRKAR